MDKEKNRLESVGRLCDIVAQLRGPGGCPWDRVQTHESLKPACIEEAAEVLGGIDILRETGRAENLKEELGDLLLQVVFHAQLAQEEGLFRWRMWRRLRRRRWCAAIRMSSTSRCSTMRASL